MEYEAGTDETYFSTTIEMACRSVGSEIRFARSSGQEHKMRSYNFWSDIIPVLQWIHSSHSKQQVFVANREAELLVTIDESQLKHVRSIHNPTDIGNRAIFVEELKGSDLPTEPAWLKRTVNELPEQVILVFICEDEEILA